MKDSGETVVVFGDAEFTDTHLLATVHAVDDEIVEWLKHREKRLRMKVRALEASHGRL